MININEYENTTHATPISEDLFVNLQCRNWKIENKSNQEVNLIRLGGEEECKGFDRFTKG